MTVNFIIPGEPQGKSRPRFARAGNFVRTYTPDKTASYEELVVLEYKRQCMRCGSRKFAKGKMLSMDIIAYFGIPKATNRKNRELMKEGYILPIKRPDIDNIIKIIADALNGLAYHDDAQIIEVRAAKMYDDNPRVEVEIRG